MKFPRTKRDEESATITQTLGLILVCSGLCALTTYAADPLWWSLPGTGSRPAVMSPQVVTNYGVVTTNYITNSYAALTQGQLKQFTARGVDELNANLLGGAGTNLNTMVSNWAQDYATNGYNATNAKPSDYTAMNVGQLKYIGNKVWARLVAGGYTNAVPAWLARDTNSDDAAANIGQLKEVFNFDFSGGFDPNGNGLPLAWEEEYFGHAGLNSSSQPDGNAYTLLQDYQDGLDPTNYYSQLISGSPGVITPSLAIAGGNNQTTASGTFTPQALIVMVTNSSGGAALGSAPVIFTVTAGGGQVAATSGGTASASLLVRTTSGGSAQVYYLQPTGTNVTSTITASSGGQTVSFTETTEAPVASGLALWFKADAGITADGSGNVSQWADQVSGITPTQATSGVKPTLVANSLNGKPAVSFNGSQRLTATNLVSLDSDFTIITCGSSHDTASERYAIGVGEVTATGGCRGFGNDGNNFILATDGYYTAPVACLGTDEDNISEVVYTKSNSTATFYERTALAGTGGVTTGTTIGDVNIGDISNGGYPRPWNGLIHEILVYNRALSDTEREQAEVYLADKYGFYNSSATWLLAYTTAVQAEINRNHWNKQQADNYVAMQGANPTMLTNGLTLWLKADAGVTQSSGNVSAWADQSGNYTVTQAISGNEPTYVASAVNGEPALHFNGSQTLNSSSSIGSGLNADMTMIVVGSTSNTTIQEYMADVGGSSSTGDDRALGYYSSDQMAAFDGTYCTGAAVPRLNSFVAEEATVNSSLTTATFFYNGLQTATASVNGLHNITPGMSVGNIYGLSELWQGDIAEVLVYDHALSAAELQQVNVYLGGKYNLTISVPPPTITPDGGTFTSTTTVAFSSVPTPAVIRYTLDGTAPTTSSPEYTGSFTLTQSCLVNAAVFFHNVQVSPIATAVFYVGDTGSIGLTDAWQIEYFGHTGVDPNALAPGGSGLTNLQAYLYGYNPNKYSTNGDGLSDLVNYELGYSATDTDINGYTDANGNPVTNAQQFAMGLDPFDSGVNPAAPTPPTPDSSDHTAPTITLYTPQGATLIP